MAAALLVHDSIMMPTMTLRRVGCALCMPYIAPFRSPFRPYHRAYAYQGLTAFASLSMAVSVSRVSGVTQQSVRTAGTARPMSSALSPRR